VCESVAKYGTEPGVVGDEKGFIVDMSRCVFDPPLRLAGRVVHSSPGCQIGYTDQAGCHQLVFGVLTAKITWWKVPTLLAGGESYVLRSEYGADVDNFAPAAFPPPYEVGLCASGIRLTALCVGVTVVVVVVCVFHSHHAVRVVVAAAAARRCWWWLWWAVSMVVVSFAGFVGIVVY
jgi:hypothetical protein